MSPNTASSINPNASRFLFRALQLSMALASLCKHARQKLLCGTKYCLFLRSAGSDVDGFDCIHNYWLCVESFATNYPTTERPFHFMNICNSYP